MLKDINAFQPTRIAYHSHSTSLPSGQQGIALVVVLMVLILIMLVGAIAVRQSNQDLKVATADQINTLLLQGADGANVKLEALVNGDPTTPQYNAATASNGIFGHFMGRNSNDNLNDEVIYCYNPRSQQYLTKQAIVRKGSGGTIEGGGNYCDPSKADNYISARQTVLTQVSISRSKENNADGAYNGEVEGRNLDDVAIQKYHFDIRATSALPAYNDPKKCFENTSITGSSMTVVRCLQNEQVPSKQSFEQADVENKTTTNTCIPMGKNLGGKVLCTLS